MVSEDSFVRDARLLSVGRRVEADDGMPWPRPVPLRSSPADKLLCGVFPEYAPDCRKYWRGAGPPFSDVCSDQAATVARACVAGELLLVAPRTPWAVLRKTLDTPVRDREIERVIDVVAARDGQSAERIAPKVGLSSLRASLVLVEAANLGLVGSEGVGPLALWYLG
jgi:hypothetical protein